MSTRPVLISRSRTDCWIVFNIQSGSITLALRQNVPDICLGSYQQQIMKKADFLNFKYSVRVFSNRETNFGPLSWK